MLTLDHQLQASAERILASAVARWGAKGATAIVMDPRTGAILAMANAPTFDANDFSSAPPEERRNRAVTDLYEPGSTFKIVTVAAALEDNVVTPDTTFTLAPTINVADRVIREAHARGTEQMTVRQILAQSSNVGTITIAKDRLGGAELASWIDRFGFGERTGSELPGESAGLVLPYESWSGSTIGTVPIGQGIAVTPLQMVSAYAAIGNGGVMAPARVVAKIGGKKVRHGKGRRVVSEHTADRMTAMFRNVVSRNGHRGRDPRLHRRGEDRDGEQGGERGLRLEVRRVVRRARAGAEAPPRDPRHGRRAARPDLGRRRRRADLPRHRPLRAQYLEVPPDAPESTRSSGLVAALSTP